MEKKSCPWLNSKYAKGKSLFSFKVFGFQGNAFGFFILFTHMPQVFFLEGSF